MMASRAVYDTDSELAKELLDIADFLRRWPPNIQIWS